MSSKSLKLALDKTSGTRPEALKEFSTSVIFWVMAFTELVIARASAMESMDFTDNYQGVGVDGRRKSFGIEKNHVLHRCLYVYSDVGHQDFSRLLPSTRLAEYRCLAILNKL